LSHNRITTESIWEMSYRDDERLQELLQAYAKTHGRLDEIVEELEPLILNYFPYRHQYYSGECKEFVFSQFRRTFTPEQNEILDQYASFKNARHQSQEQKAIAESAQYLRNYKLKRYYHFLGNICFPSLPAVRPSEEKSEPTPEPRPPRSKREVVHKDSEGESVASTVKQSYKTPSPSGKRVTRASRRDSKEDEDYDDSREKIIEENFFLLSYNGKLFEEVRGNYVPPGARVLVVDLVDDEDDEDDEADSIPPSIAALSVDGSSAVAVEDP